MEANFPPNSKNQKPEASEPAVKDVKKVITGEVVRRKKPLGTRFKELFITGEDSRGVFEFIMDEHILPGIRDIVFDSAMGGLEKKLYGGEARGRRRGTPNVVSNGMGLLTNYGSFSGGPQPGPQRAQLSRRARSVHNFDEIVFPTKMAAEDVLTAMYELLSKFEEVTVADFYQCVGQTPEFTDEKYGWLTLQGSHIQRARGGGYVIGLPPTEVLVA